MFVNLIIIILLYIEFGTCVITSIDVDAIGDLIISWYYIMGMGTETNHRNWWFSFQNKHHRELELIIFGQGFEFVCSIKTN